MSKVILTTKEDEFGNKAIVKISSTDFKEELDTGDFIGKVEDSTLILPEGITHIGDISDNNTMGIESDIIDFLGMDDDDQKLITTIKLPRSLKKIKTGFFDNFPNLQHIIFSGPSEIEAIYPMAFANCTKLEELVIPENASGKIIDIRPDIVVNCAALKKFVTPSNSTTILYCEQPFQGCSELEEVHINGFAKKFHPRANVKMPDGRVDKKAKREGNVRTFGMMNNQDYVQPVTECSFLFEDIKGQLKRVTIPNSVTKIEYEAFEGCEGLTSVTIPDGVTSIGKRAFSGCEKLMSVTIADGVTSIDDGAFEWCSGLTSVTIPDGVTSIGDGAFKWCSGLTCIAIPGSITSIGKRAFYGCEKLTSVTIADGVTKIGESAFSGCKGLTSVTIPDSVTSIGESAFSGCNGLTSVTIADGVTSIGERAFAYCVGLTGITIPDSVTYIGREAFLLCKYLRRIICSNPDIRNLLYQACDQEAAQNITFVTPEEALTQEQELENGETGNSGSISVDDIRECTSDVNQETLENTKKQLKNEQNKDLEEHSSNTDNPDDILP